MQNWSKQSQMTRNFGLGSVSGPHRFGESQIRIDHCKVDQSYFLQSKSDEIWQKIHKSGRSWWKLFDRIWLKSTDGEEDETYLKGDAKNPEKCLERSLNKVDHNCRGRLEIWRRSVVGHCWSVTNQRSSVRQNDDPCQEDVEEKTIDQWKVIDERRRLITDDGS